MATLGDFMADYEAELLAKGRAEMAREAAEWAALSDEERQAVLDARAAAVEALWAPTEPGDEAETCDDCGEELDDGDCPSCDAD